MRSLNRRFPTIVALLVTCLVAAACGDDSEPDPTAGATGTGAGDRPAITIGSFDFSESAILAHIYAEALEAEGYDVTVRSNLGNREVVAPALEKGEIDLYPGYAATDLEYFNEGAGEATSDPDETVAKLNERLEAKGLVALKPSPAIDTNAFAVTQETAERYDLQTVSDLADVAGELTLGGPPECPERPFCAKGLKDVYGIEFGDFKPLDAGGPLTKTALENGDIDVALIFSSDGAIPAKNFVVLEDDKNLQNADNVVAILRSEVATDEVRRILSEVNAALTTETLAELNKRADLDKEDPEALAEEWVEANYPQG